MDSQAILPIVGQMDVRILASLIAVIGILLTLIANRLLLEVSRRHEKQAVITAIRSNVRSIVQALHMMRLVDSFIVTARSSTVAPQYPSWVDSPRGEDYFQLFGALASKIGMAPLRLTREVVRFYTFLRVSRDAATPLAKVKVSHISDGQHIKHATNVLLAFSQLLNAAETVLSPKYSQSGPDDNGWDIAKGLREKVDAALTQISADASARTS